MWNRVVCVGALGAAMVMNLGGCASREPALVAPLMLSAPYDRSRGEVLWAVAPLANESGVSTVDTLQASDTLVARLEEVEGIATVPVNRVIAGMRLLKMDGVRSNSDVRRLAETLGVDAIIVGTITAYDPYDPPTVGLTLALYGREGRLGAPAPAQVDPSKLRTQYSEPSGGAPVREQPLSVVAEMYAGSSQGVQMNLQTYAQGRTESQSALGWRGYLANTNRYMEFVSYWTLKRLLEAERVRLAPPPPPAAAGAAKEPGAK